MWLPLSRIYYINNNIANVGIYTIRRQRETPSKKKKKRKSYCFLLSFFLYYALQSSCQTRLFLFLFLSILVLFLRLFLVLGWPVICTFYVRLGWFYSWRFQWAPFYIFSVFGLAKITYLGFSFYSFVFKHVENLKL